MTDCLFCKIAANELDADIVYESEDVVAFTDINPVASTHILVIPRRHIASAMDLTKADGPVLGEMFGVLSQLARDRHLEGGHRIVTNVGPGAGQSVHHVHFHLIGGREMSWPPG
jgi:histidine triad (HIT) family protein